MAEASPSRRFQGHNGEFRHRLRPKQYMAWRSPDCLASAADSHETRGPLTLKQTFSRQLSVDVPNRSAPKVQTKRHGQERCAEHLVHWFCAQSRIGEVLHAHGPSIPAARLMMVHAARAPRLTESYPRLVPLSERVPAPGLYLRDGGACESPPTVLADDCIEPCSSGRIRCACFCTTSPGVAWRVGHMRCPRRNGRCERERELRKNSAVSTPAASCSMIRIHSAQHCRNRMFCLLVGGPCMSIEKTNNRKTSNIDLKDPCKTLAP